jgi:hypothetical protein
MAREFQKADLTPTSIARRRPWWIPPFVWRGFVALVLGSREHESDALTRLRGGAKSTPSLD